ncbi:MAG TPA: hypothetical protein GXX58_07735 [Gelria sp.]|jgi:hypothetical protein|nr:hypothetical protein [Gelria sp.]
MNETGLEIFLNISVNFSEINIVKYEYNSDLLIVEVALGKEIPVEQEKKFITSTQECMELLHKLDESTPKTFKIKFKRLAGLTFLRYYRDAKSLNENEINLLISLLREEFDDCLLSEGLTTLTRNSFKKQIKRDLLQQLNNEHDTGYLFAYRDHGRLCMFNRNTGGL